MPTVTISSIASDFPSHTITCTSTGSPATNVTWIKDGSPLTIDGTTYIMKQTVTERSTSTYTNVLIIGPDVGSSGMYTCTVSNSLGSNSMNLELSGWFHCMVTALHKTSVHCILHTLVLTNLLLL